MSEADQSRTSENVPTRAALRSIPAYRPGQLPKARDGVTPHKMSSNENPYPPLPGVVERAAQVAGRMNRYPDMFCTKLTQRLADECQVPEDDVIIGTGSSGVLQQTVLALCEAGDDVVYAWRSFEAYPIMVGLAGARSVQVPLDDQGHHDLPAMAAAIGPRTRIVFVCTPNNPTGPVVTGPEMRDFLAKVPRDVLVVVDEAYVEFVRDDQAAQGLELYREYPNVMVLRTFSKAYGLAGLRVGYGIAHAPVSTAIRKTGVPFGVSAIAEEAALISLDEKPALDERVARIVDERSRVVAALAAQGWDLPRSEGNFVWLHTGERTDAVAAALGQSGLSVRAFSGEGLRCSIDSPEANDALLEALKPFTSRGGQHR
ncbi:histidinol-phosphate aminotransferase [Austwickia chelonae]|uniref:Aromatic amino acid aminotransferase n=1 Tax=Austwickia chelonae NBRC 105200 TaxID=1184607 RepID=K6UP01_9MICO|nr:histidinol-phosphate transaminase [Austwickia chelonae]GAB79396.1 histidinol-phosphate aminotransferase [Austwickia chelonae NBRC 105200]SEW43563.1 histidinol-phosphate aminotransferase [Austwickia chelonae]